MISVDIEKKDKFHRLWLGIYFSFSSFNLMAVWPNEWIRFVFVQIGNDLSGTHDGLQVRELWNVPIFDSLYFQALLFFLTLGASYFFYRYRRPVLNSLSLFVVVLVTAYAMPGRHFMLEIMGLILLSTLASNLVSHLLRYDSARRSFLSVNFNLASVAFMYFCAFLTKVNNVGWAWTGEHMLSFFFKFHEYLIETECIWPPEIELFKNFFLEPSLLNHFLLVGVLLVEGASPLFLLHKVLREKLAPLIWISLNVGFTIVIGVFSRPILMSLLLISLPVKVDPKIPKLPALLLGWVGLLTLASWSFPLDKYKSTSVVFPFSRFDMFGGWKISEAENRSVRLYMFKPMGDTESFSTRKLLSPTRHNAYFLVKKMHFENLGKGLESTGPQLCDFIQRRWIKDHGTLPENFEIWIRRFYLEESLPKVGNQKIFDCLKSNYRGPHVE